MKLFIHSFFNSTTVEVWGCVSNFIPHSIGHVISYPCWGWSLPLLVKGAPEMDAKKITPMLANVCHNICVWENKDQMHWIRILQTTLQLCYGNLVYRVHANDVVVPYIKLHTNLTTRMDAINEHSSLIWVSGEYNISYSASLRGIEM